MSGVASVILVAIVSQVLERLESPVALWHAGGRSVYPLHPTIVDV